MTSDDYSVRQLRYDAKWVDTTSFLLGEFVVVVATRVKALLNDVVANTQRAL